MNTTMKKTGRLYAKLQRISPFPVQLSPTGYQVKQSLDPRPTVTNKPSPMTRKPPWLTTYVVHPSWVTHRRPTWSTRPPKPSARIESRSIRQPRPLLSLLLVIRGLTSSASVTQRSPATRWLPEEVEGVQDWRWATSNTGWSNYTLAYDWLERVFEPCTSPPAPTRRLLIVDGHGSHVKARFIALCITHAIDLMVLPAHTSHITQPLDIGVFGPLKHAMTRVNDAAAVYDSGRIPKAIWASQLAAARILAMKRAQYTGWMA